MGSRPVTRWQNSWAAAALIHSAHSCAATHAFASSDCCASASIICSATGSSTWRWRARPCAGPRAASTSTSAPRVHRLRLGRARRSALPYSAAHAAHLGRMIHAGPPLRSDQQCDPAGLRAGAGDGCARRAAAISAGHPVGHDHRGGHLADHAAPAKTVRGQAQPRDRGHELRPAARGDRAGGAAAGHPRGAPAGIAGSGKPAAGGPLAGTPPVAGPPPLRPATPAAGVLTSLMFMLGVMQIGPLPVLVPAALWLMWHQQVAAGVALAVWAGLLSIGDNLLRPWLIQRGAKLPFVLVLGGVLGGLLAFGIGGIFIGPILLAVLQRLMARWVEET